MENSRFKLRAWDKVYRCMIVENITIDLNGNIKVHDKHNCNNRFELMKFTESEDKNDVEIFEGDVLSYNGNGVNFGSVKFDKDNAMFYADGYECYINAGSFKNCVVVGNIYENNNLLNT